VIPNSPADGKIDSSLMVINKTATVWHLY